MANQVAVTLSSPNAAANLGRSDARSSGVLSDGAAERIEQSDIKQMFITDTIESPEMTLPKNVEVVSVASLFAQAIRSIHDRTSVSMLFPDTSK